MNARLCLWIFVLVCATAFLGLSVLDNSSGGGGGGGEGGVIVVQPKTPSDALDQTTRAAAAAAATAATAAAAAATAAAAALETIDARTARVVAPTAEAKTLSTEVPPPPTTTGPSRAAANASGPSLAAPSDECLQAPPSDDGRLLTEVAEGDGGDDGGGGLGAAVAVPYVWMLAHRADAEAWWAAQYEPYLRHPASRCRDAVDSTTSSPSNKEGGAGVAAVAVAAPIEWSCGVGRRREPAATFQTPLWRRLLPPVAPMGAGWGGAGSPEYLEAFLAAAVPPYPGNNTMVAIARNLTRKSAASALAAD